MYARVATFEGDPANVDEAISTVRGDVESGNPPPGLEGAKMLMLVNRESGKGLGITLFESEEALKNSEDVTKQIRSDAAKKIGAAIQSVERFEVLAQA